MFTLPVTSRPVLKADMFTRLMAGMVADTRIDAQRDREVIERVSNTLELANAEVVCAEIDPTTVRFVLVIVNPFIPPP
jgi:hypothetical protein